MGFTATISVSLKSVAGTLCCALEGGSNYWCVIDEYIEPEVIEAVIASKWGEFEHIAFPLSKGGGLVLRDTEGETGTTVLDLARLAKGVQAMASNHPHHFSDMALNKSDASTGDCLLQCCLFEKVIYG